MYITIYVYIYIYIYIYTHIGRCVYKCLHICIHACLYTCQTRRPSLSPGARSREGGTRKGTNVVSTNGVTADFMLFDRGTFFNH